VFVLCPKRKVAYIGSVDDKQNVNEVKTNYLRDALDALLAGKEPPKATTNAFGCSVKYEKK